MVKKELLDGECVFDVPENSELDVFDLEGCENLEAELVQSLKDFAKISSIVKDKTLEKDELKKIIIQLWDGAESPFPTKWGRVIFRKGWEGKEAVDDKASAKLLDKALNFNMALDLLEAAGHDRAVMKGILVDAMGQFDLPMKKTAGRSATLEFEGI
jgi:hypothetical protein